MKDNYAFPAGPRPGMELRDWFAGMALMGLVSQYWARDCETLDHQDYAREAYSLADAMMENSRA